MILTNFIVDRKERTRFIRFAIVGAVGAVVDFSTFNLLAIVFGIYPVVASVLSFTVAVLSNFTWNRIWTYPDSRSKPLSRQLLEFSVVNVIGAVIRTPLFAFLDHPLQKLYSYLSFLPIGLVNAEFLGHNSALAVAIIVVLFWNFFVNRYWTYSDV
jgi:putative flippase GtrA